jgi:hypothetical protein
MSIDLSRGRAGSHFKRKLARRQRRVDGRDGIHEIQPRMNADFRR